MTRDAEFKFSRLVPNDNPGMFLWVRLVVSDLRDQGSLGTFREAVDKLPNGLNEAWGPFSKTWYLLADSPADTIAS